MTQEDPPNIWNLIRRHRASWPATSFLKTIPDGALTALIEAASLVRFDEGDDLIREGAATTEAYLLLCSYVKVTARFSRNSQALLAVRTGGDVVGEIAATGGGPRIATVRVCGREPVFAARLTRDDFARATAGHPEAVMRLTHMVGRKLRAATRRHVDFLDCEPPERLARVLVELAEDHGQPSPGRRKGIIIGFDVRQVELGTLIGVSESTAHRAMKELREDGLVDTRHIRLLIPNLAALRERAGWGGQPVS